MKKVVYELVAINWTEYERGWGCRPDGWTVYKTMNAALAVVRDDIDEKLKTDGGVPDDYSVPSKPFVIRLDKKTHDKLIAQINKGKNWGEGSACPYQEER